MVEGGEDAAACIFGEHGTAAGWEGVIDAVAQLVAALHRGGVYHHDLNLRNFLLTPQGRVLILDVDKVSLRCRPLGPLARRRNLARLVRSVRKLGRAAGAPWLEQVVARLHRSYGVASERA